jgi:hypothetical protein
VRLTLDRVLWGMEEPILESKQGLGRRERGC